MYACMHVCIYETEPKFGIRDGSWPMLLIIPGFLVANMTQVGVHVCIFVHLCIYETEPKFGI